jgi:hypothetical protein
LLSEASLSAVHIAVIGGEDDKGSVGNALLVEGIEKTAEAGIESRTVRIIAGQVGPGGFGDLGGYVGR